LLKKQRDKAAAKRFFKRVLRSNPPPRQIVTDQLRSYPAAKADIPELVNVKHVFVKAAARVNNRAENRHQPTRERERRMRGFRDPKRTQAFLSSFGPIRQHFALKRHLLRASLYRKHLAGPVRRMARIYQCRPNSVECFPSYWASSINTDEVRKLTVPDEGIRDRLRGVYANDAAMLLRALQIVCHRVCHDRCSE
jgi:putative transposase